MVEFITDNYIWFIVGGVILLMALIGYIAEKTNFGRGYNDGEDTREKVKKEKVKKEKPKKEKNKVKEDAIIAPVEESLNVELDAPQSEEIFETETSNEDISLSPESLLEQELSSELPVEPVHFEQSPQDEFLNFNNSEENVETIEEDLTVPLVLEDKANDIENIDLGIQEVIAEEPFVESPDLDEIKVENVDVPEAELPNIEEVSNKEEDIWKF